MSARRLIVEADGGSRGNPGVAGYGALVRDAKTGELLSERSAPLGKASNNVAEYSGLIAGLKAALLVDEGALIEVRMDSKLVIEQMAGRWKIKHEDMKRLALEARDVVRRLSAAGGAVQWTWIPREKNKDADKLSNDGMDGRTIERDLWRDAEPAVPLADEPTPVDVAADQPAPDVSLDQPTPVAAVADDRGAVAEQLLLSTDETPASPPDVGRPTRVLLVRHGVTDFTVSHRLDGRGGANPSLNAEGQAQAKRAAQGVRDLLRGADGPVVVVTSSLARAMETGGAVAEALGVTPSVDADWDEQSFGVWDGLTFGEIQQRYPGDMQRMRVEAAFAVEGGESNQALDERVRKALDQAVEAAGRGGTTVIATHRKPIMAVLASVLGMTHERAWRLAAAPASLTGLEIWGDGVMQVAFVNDMHHHDGA